MKKKIKFISFTVLLLIISILSSYSFVAASEMTVKEGDLVRLKVSATDQDNDKLTYYFPQPFNSQGEWQTTYGDAGEYDIEVLVSDGKNEVLQHVRLLVEKRNQPPILTKTEVTVKEGETIDLKQFVNDPDKDPLTYSFPSPFSKSGTWKTSFGDAGYKIIHFYFTDDEFNQSGKIAINIIHSNQPPQINSVFDEKALIELSEGKEYDFFVKAKDPESDSLEYLWQLDNQTISNEQKFKYTFSYASEGDHYLTLEVTDGLETIRRTWTLLVKDSNRPPTITLPSLSANENERITLQLPPQDQDGDDLMYTLPPPFKEDGTWQTTYGDAGIHFFPITVSDGKTTLISNVTITIGKVNRPPQFNLPPKAYLSEGQQWVFPLEITDPDNDQFTLTIDGLPSDAALSQPLQPSEKKQISWQPSYDYIQRKGGMISNVLNTLRVEQLLLREKKIPLTIHACDPQQCSNSTLTLVVYNVNRPAILLPLQDVIVKETETVQITPTAQDPDEDILHFSLTPPVGKRTGKWKTTFEDQGEYTTYVTATDGKNPDTKPVKITVLKTNRPPTITIKNDDVTVNENQQFQITAKATDPDNDNITLSLENPPADATFTNGAFVWSPSFETVQNKTATLVNDLSSSSQFLNKKFNSEETVLWLTFKASDGELETIHPVKITIKNINRAPQIAGYTPDSLATAKVEQPVRFTINAADEDADTLSYYWTFGIAETTVEGTNIIDRTFTYPGTKQVTVKVSDGRDSMEKTWEINVVEEESSIPITVPAPEQSSPITGSATSDLPSEEIYKVYVIEHN